MKRPFINVAWNRPFLPALIDIALELTEGDLGRAFCIFPHSRPALYLTEHIRNDPRIPKPCILPRMESVSGLFRSIARDDAGAVPIGLLDQVALLLAIVRDLRGTQIHLENKKQLTDFLKNNSAVHIEGYASFRMAEYNYKLDLMTYSLIKKLRMTER